MKRPSELRIEKSFECHLLLVTDVVQDCFVSKKHLLFQMNLSNSGLKNRSIKEYWLIFTVLKFPLGLQFSHNLTKGLGSIRGVFGPMSKISFTLSNYRFVIRDKNYKRYFVI